MRFELCDKLLSPDALAAKLGDLTARLKALYPNIDFTEGSHGLNGETGNHFISVRLPDTPATSPEREYVEHANRAHARCLWCSAIASWPAAYTR